MLGLRLQPGGEAGDANTCHRAPGPLQPNVALTSRPQLSVCVVLPLLFSSPHLPQSSPLSSPSSPQSCFFL